MSYQIYTVRIDGKPYPMVARNRWSAFKTVTENLMVLAQNIDFESVKVSGPKPLRNMIVEPSRNGLGLFSKTSWKAGDVVSILTGQMVSGDSYSSYRCVRVTDAISLELSDPYSFINHSCVPNAQFVWDPEELEMFLVALNSIRKGDELTVDYGWSESGGAVECNCGHRKCKGTI